MNDELHGDGKCYTKDGALIMKGEFVNNVF